MIYWDARWRVVKQEEFYMSYTIQVWKQAKMLTENWIRKSVPESTNRKRRKWHSQTNLQDDKLTAGISFLHAFFFIHASFHLLFKKIFIWLHWVLVPACRIFAASRGILCCGVRAQLWHAGLVGPWHVESQFPHQGLNPCLLHCKVDF